MTTRQDSVRHRVFVDTSAFFAFINANDRSHAPAESIMRRLAEAQSQLLTTNFISAETHALLLTRLGRSTALHFLDDLDSGSTTVVRVTSGDEQRARHILRQYQDKDFSLTDATSFTVMERLSIPVAFAFDNDFTQYGLRTLTP
jgi:predicted nucleic acid-binding protein